MTDDENDYFFFIGNDINGKSFRGHIYSVVLNPN
jgi:hypothetical protein